MLIGCIGGITSLAPSNRSGWNGRGVSRRTGNAGVAARLDDQSLKSIYYA